MKRLGYDTCVHILSSVTRITTSAKRTAIAILHPNKNLRSGTLSISVSLSLLLVGLVVSPSMHGMLRRGGSVTAFDESIHTFASSDCATPKSVWDLGQTACAVATGAVGSRRIAWVAPDGAVAQLSSDFSDTASDSYAIPTVGNFAQVGTWTVQTIDASGVGFSSAEFVVKDPANASVDLSIGNFGPFQISPGNNINYRVEVTNKGPDSAQSVTLTSPVPGSTTFVSEAQNSGPEFTCTTPTVGSATGTISCTIATLPANTTAVFTLAFSVDANAPDGSTITSAASVTSTTNELHAADNTASSEATVTAGSTSCTLNCGSSINADNDANQCSAVVSYPTPTTSGNCGSAPDNTVICNPPSGSVFPIGATAVSCSTQSGGACSFTVTVHDTRPPVQPTISCPANVTVGEDAPDSGSAPVSYASPATTGNCVTTVCDPASGSRFNVGTTTVNCTATDSSNNAVTCSFIVTVTSGAACILNCSGDITEAAPANQCNAVVNYSAPSTTGSCGTVTCTPSSGSSFPVGTTVVTCTSSQGPTCDFTVTVTAPAAPTIVTCASNKAVPVDANCEGVIPNLLSEVTTTGCNVTTSQSPAAGSVVGAGIYIVVITAENTAGEATCSATVTVDTTPPVITCPAGTSASANSNCQAPVPNVVGGVTASDNCTDAGSLTITQNPAAGTLVSVGATTITVTVKDDANNTATCTTTFTVTDATPPTALCKNITVPLDADGNASITAAQVDNGSSDNCGITSRTVSPSTFTCANKGSNTVTLTVTDPSGNSSSCQSTVTVVDNTPPTVSCPANIARSNDAGQCSAVVIYATPTPSDNCPGATAGCFPTSGSVFPKGTTIVNCTATDASNNTSSCSFTVTVNDTQPPTITCPANQTLEPTCPTGAVATYTAPVGTDNCPGATTVRTGGPASGSVFPIGTTTVTYTVTDSATNSTSCSFTVTVLTVQATIQNMITSVQALQPPLSGQQVQGLSSKLQAALDAVNTNKTNVACNKLADFISQLSGFISNGTLTSAQGQPLLNSAAHVRNTLGCTTLGCS